MSDDDPGRGPWFCGLVRMKRRHVVVLHTLPHLAGGTLLLKIGPFDCLADARAFHTQWIGEPDVACGLRLYEEAESSDLHLWAHRSLRNDCLTSVRATFASPATSSVGTLKRTHDTLKAPAVVAPPPRKKMKKQ